MENPSVPKITFGIIVLNGEPFTLYNLRTLYPYAHQIIVVEGAVPAAVEIATEDGHSTDGTLEMLRQFKAEYDLDNKIIIVTAEDEGHPNGFWPGEKHEQSQAYACRATGDYLWQVDIDEFYKQEDIQSVITMLQNDPEITTISFKMITFWGGFDYITDGWYLRQGAEIYHRLFKWEPGYSYITHRPPTVYDSYGRNLRDLNWINGYELAHQHGIVMYHYSLLFPKQVIEKCQYYGNATWTVSPEAQRWAQDVFLNLKNSHRVHNVYHHPSWLDRFSGKHPAQIEALRTDLEVGRLKISMRPNADIENLLNSPIYSVTRWALKVLYWVWHLSRWKVKSAIGRITNWVIGH